jgi:hypothetical protein
MCNSLPNKSESKKYAVKFQGVGFGWWNSRAGVSMETKVYTLSSLRWRELAEGAEACEIESPS